MQDNTCIYDLILSNIHKIILPEEVIRLELSISRFELIALMLADKYQTITMGNLARNMSMSMSTVTGVVDRLVKKGFLIRGSSEEDRRVVTVSPTEDGRALINQLKEYFHDFVGKVKGMLTEEEFATALTIMHKIITGFQNNQTEADITHIPQRKKIEID